MVNGKISSNIQLHMAAIFSLSNLYLNHGIGLVCVMVDFICMGLL